MKKLLLALSVALLCYGAKAQTPQLVHDINPGKAHGRPGGLTLLNGKLYFGAADSSGRELWEWHAMGTPPTKISDSYPGVASSWYHDDRIPMAIFNGSMHYRGFTSNTSHNMMSYSGTGTPMVAVANVAHPSAPGCSWLTVFGNKLYYVADSIPGHRGFLYSYDGTDTTLVTKLSPNSYTASWVPVLMPYGSHLLFAKEQAGKGFELSAYTPTTGQTGLISDIAPGTRSSNPREFLSVGNKIYFVATDSANGDELWSYDGSSTTRLTNVAPGSANGISFSTAWNNLAFYKGGIYFSGSNASGYSALYKYDTTTKTVSLACDPKLPGNTGGAIATGLYATPHNLYFYYNNPATTGVEPWKFDGTNGTMLADINPGKGNGAGTSNFLLMDNYVYFAAGDTATTGYELYRIYDQPTNVGIGQTTWAGKASVVPNPVVNNGMLIIHSAAAEQLQVSLINMSGRLLYATELQTHTGSTQLQLPMAALPAGQYYYRISNQQGLLLYASSILKQ